MYDKMFLQLIASLVKGILELRKINVDCSACISKL